SAGVVMNMLFAILVLIGSALVFGEPRNPTTQAVVVGELNEVAAPLASIPFGARITAVGGVPVSSWNDIVAALDDAPAGPITLSIADAPDVQLVLPESHTERRQMLEPLQPLTQPIIGDVEPGSPAARAGIQPGDRVLSAAGQPIRSWNEFVEIVRGRPG